MKLSKSKDDAVDFDDTLDRDEDVEYILNGTGGTDLARMTRKGGEIKDSMFGETMDAEATDEVLAKLYYYMQDV